MGSVTACFARVAKTLSPEDREAILKPIRDEITGRISAASKADPNADANAVALEVLDGMLSGATAPSPADGASATPTKEKPDAGDVGARSQAGQDAAATPGDGRQRQGGQDDAQAQDGLKAKPRTLREAQERRAAATHQDPGEKPEAATPAVVAESLQKAAKREQVSPKQMLADALRVIDEAIARAPDNKDEEKDAPLKATINVPGDGTFKVINTKERLREFRALVERSPGFTGKNAKPRVEKAVTSGDLSPNALAREMLSDGEWLNAMEVLDAAGKPMMFGNGTDGEPIPYTDVQPIEIAGFKFFSGHAYSSKKEREAPWRVVHIKSGLAAGWGTTRADAVEQATKAMKEEKARAKVSSYDTGNDSQGKPFPTQDELREAFSKKAQARQESTFAEQDRLAAIQAEMNSKERERQALYEEIMGAGQQLSSFRTAASSNEGLIRGFLNAAEKQGRAADGIKLLDDVFPESNVWARKIISDWEKASTKNALEVGYNTVKTGAPPYTMTWDEIEPSITAQVYVTRNARGEKNYRQWQEAHFEAVKEAVSRGWRVPDKVLYDYPTALRSDLSDDDKDLASDAMVTTYQQTKDYGKAVQAYRDWKPGIDLKGFERTQKTRDGFVIEDGDITILVSKTKTWDGKERFQARLKNSTTSSSPNLTEQQAIDWADVLRQDMRKAAPAPSPAPAAQPKEPAHFAELRERAAAYWDGTVVPAVREYLNAYDAMGAAMMERNRIKPEGMSAREWLESWQRRKSEWDGSRKTQTTGIQGLSQKDLWPTTDGRGERLRKAMLAAIKALNGAPMTNSEMMDRAFGLEAEAASQSNPPAPRSVQDLIRAYQQADEAQERLGKARAPLDQLGPALDAATKARDALAERLSEEPDEAFGLTAKTSDGRPLILTPSPQKKGQYQLTRFGSDGEPWGDSQYTSKSKAVDDFIREADLSTLRVGAEGREVSQQETANDRDTFTLERLNRGTNEMEPVTFKRGEYVRASLLGSDGSSFGEIDGISHARREFSVDGLWHPFGAAYKAERPAEPKKPTVPLSSVVDAVNAKYSKGLGPADAVSSMEAFKGVMNALYDGTASLHDYRAGYKRVRDAEAVKAELGKMTKDDLINTFGIMARPGETKSGLIDSAYKSMLRGFALGKEYGPNGYMMTRGGLEAYEKQKAEALDAIVEATTAEDLAKYADQMKAQREERAARRAQAMEALKDPKTIPEFRAFIEYHIRDGKTNREARMLLTPEQRALMDDLWATSTRGSRKERTDEQRTQVRVAGQTVDGQIIATKHTRKGHDLFVVRLAERVSREDYETLNAGAKKIGGYYSSFRGNGAIPGFQFNTREQAEAFVKLAGGDNADAQAAAQERRDAYADDRSQTAAERLTEMADRMDEAADESMGRERKANTERRARFAAAAEAGAREAKAMAKTMRNVAEALTAGTVKFLDRVRTKTQVELLQTYVANAKSDELRAKYDSYAEQEKRRGPPPTQETADYAEFPQYTAYRSDLASLGRRLLEVDGTKKLGERLMKVADDVSDAFTAFAKEPGNLFKLSTFSVRAGDEVRTAIFKDRETAERAIKRSGLSGKAIVFPEKRGVNRIIMSPSEAMARGIWKGDGDKRITLSDEFGAELVEGIGRAAKRGSKVNDRLNAPWQFERAYERRKQLSRMGLETPAEFRAALREFIGLREQAAEADKIKAMERAMIGRRNDGLDFFPTPESVADEMVAAADIQPEMSVLEPSAGMGHIADRIRAAGAEPDVIEMAVDRRELLQEKGYHLMPYSDFLQMEPRGFYTFGDVMRAPDGTEGVMHGGGMGRASLHELNADGTEGKMLGWFDRAELVGVRHRGGDSGYDRIVMNPPFSDGRDIQHVRHAYSLLKPGGRLVALMSESAFTNQNKRATEFREWLESVGGTEEKLPEGSFMDPSLPVNTGANARMVVIEKADGDVNLSLGEQAPNLRVDATELAPDTAQAYATASDADQRAVRRLQTSMARYIPGLRLDAVAAAGGREAGQPLQGADRARVAAAELLRALTGRRAVFFRSSGGPVVNGVHSSLAPDVLFLRHDATRPHMAVLGHEFLHGLRQDRPDLYDVLRDRMRLVSTRKHEPGADLQEKRRKLGLAPLSADALEEEFLADVMGDSWMDASFWKSLAGKEPNTLLRRAFTAAMRFVDDVLRKIADLNPFGTNAYLSDIKAARAAMAQALRDYVEVESVGAPAVDLNFSLGAGGQAQTDTPEFRRWFGDSKVVDAQGRPLVVYHGTGRDVEVFSSAAPTATDKGGWGRGFYFAADPGYAAVYARKGAAPNVMPVYVSLRNPIVVAADGEWGARANAIKALGLDVPRGDPRAEWATEFTEAAQAKGHDGVIHTIGGRPAEVVAFRPEQIKSAVGNNGQFDPGNPDIRFSLGGAVDTLQSNDTARRLSERVIDVLRSDSTIGLLGRTVGTPYHLAHAKRADGSLRNPDLRKVYDEAQDYLNDINTFANDPANLAPRVVPMLNTWRDALPASLGGQDLRLAGAQRSKLARALFEGTLGWTRDDQGNAVQTDDPHKGIEWTGTELRQRFGFNDADVKLYEQTRAAIGRSLDLMAGAEVARQMGGRDLPEGLRAMVSRGDTGRFKGLVLGFLTQQVDAAESAVRTLKAEHREQLARFAEATPGPDTAAMRDALKARQAAALEQAEAKLGKWKSLQAGVQKTYERVEDLKDRGYMPLMRFGPHTVTVRDIDTKEVVFFGMYETQAEANVEARKLRETAEPNEAVSRGEMSQEQWRLFKGMSPETVELFGQVAGIERTPVFEEYIRRTKANHSALKRLIQRKGTPGFSEDVQRVLAAFLTSNARAAAANLHAGAMEEATLDIDQERGLVKDYATKLTQYVQNPTDEAQWLRGLMFTQFIGGSVASAMVNMTQPFTMTLPWLSQHSGPVGAARLLTAGMRSALTRIAPDSDLGKAMARAEKDGIVSPQALHELQGQAVNRFGRTESALRAMGVSTKAAEVIDASLRRALFAWGGFFSLAEQFNRRATFIAAYQLAQEKGMADAFAFAEEAVTETQGQYSRANRPQWARGPVMSTVFTFKQFSIAYIEFLARLPRRERAIAMAVLLVAAGLEGLPFADDLDDLIDTIAQRLFGKAFSAKRAKVELLSEVLGRDGAEWVLRGASALPGFPVDLAGRMSLGNMIPGTGLLRTDGSRDKSSEVLEALGPAGGVLRDALRGEFLPVAARNAVKAAEMARTGQYRDELGRKVADVDGADAVAKGLGFQPREIARESRDSRMAQSVVAQTRAEESEIVRLWAQGIVDGEPDKVTQAQEQLAAWNQRNPDARIAINRVQIARMARDMRATREDRVIRAAPKELRGRVAEELR